MKKNIIIFYNHISREYKASLKLKEELEKAMNVRVYVFSIGFEFHKAILLSKIKSIDAIISSICSETNYELFGPIIAANKNVKIISLYGEQTLDDLTIEMCMPPQRYQNYMFHFVWNSFIKDILVKRGVKEDLIYVNGNIRSDEVFNLEGLKSREELAEEFGLSLEKEWLLFAEGRNAYKDADPETLREDSKRFNIDEDLYVKSFLLMKDSFLETLKDIEKLDDSFFEKYELIFRPHPSSNEPFDIDGRAKLIYKYTVYDWIKNVKANIVWTSTSAFEAEAMGVPPIVCEVIPNMAESRPYGIENYIRVSSLSQINDELLESARQKMKDKNFERYMCVVDGKCTERTANAVGEILKCLPINPEKVEKKVGKVLFAKYFAYGAIVEVLSKLHLFEALKWPATAYNVRKDSPFNKENLSITGK